MQCHLKHFVESELFRQSDVPPPITDTTYCINLLDKIPNVVL